MTTYRQLLMMFLVVIVAASFVFFLLGEPSWADAGWALFLVVIWSPVKGVTYRRLGGRLPYLGALLGSISWQAVGLPIDLDSFWLIMGVSFLAGVAIETLALGATGTAPNFARCLFLALYGNLIVHLIQVGWFASQRSLAIGVPFLLAGIFVFFIPAFYADYFAQEPR